MHRFMFISRFELLLDIAEDAKIRTPAKSLREIFTNGGFGKDNQDEHIGMRDDKDKFGISWRYSQISIIQEDYQNSADECVKKFQTNINKINNVAPIGKLSRKRLKVHWIIPSVNFKDFVSLEKKYRDIFINDKPLFKDCTDSSIVIDMRYGGWLLHHQSGPMKLEQLQTEFRVFKIKEGHPKLFIFLDTVLFDDELAQYSVGSMEQFMSNGFTLCQSHADGFQKVLEGI